MMTIKDMEEFSAVVEIEGERENVECDVFKRWQPLHNNVTQ